jgi:branched-subunit amino acid transport protein
MLLVVLLAALGTWLLRVAFIVMLPAERLPARVRRVLDDAGPVVLAAMAAHVAVAGHASGLHLAPMAVGGAAAALVAWRTTNFLGTVLAGVAVYAAVSAALS